MKKFIVTYHALAEMLQRESDNPADTEGGDMKAWESWAQNTGEYLVEFSSPAANGLTIKKDKFPEASSSDFCGYSILRAESAEHAAELMKSNPHMNWDSRCFVEIHEILS